MVSGALSGVLPASARQVQRLPLDRPADLAESVPAAPEEQALDSEVISLSEISPGGGVVVLGESGMGKTTALAQLRKAWKSAGTFDRAVEVDLESVPDTATFDVLITSELKQCLRVADDGETSPGFRATHPSAANSSNAEPASSDAEDGSAQPCVLLILDHVDRCGLGPTLLGNLIHRLSRDPGVCGFTLLCACRDTDWPVTLTEQLRRATPGLQVVRLLPLRWCDVAALAEISRVDPGQFLEAVDAAGVWPLAEIPMSAKLLITLFKDNAVLPSDPASLYEKGLHALVKDPDSSWTTPSSSRGRAPLTAPRKMAVAARIAAWLHLCGFYAVSTATVMDASTVDLPWWEVVGGSEPATGGDLGINEASVLEVLDCGLFTSVRPDRRTVRHESFTTFLTARYLHRRKFTEKQLRGLLLASKRAGAKVHPLLRETAAWLVALDPAAYGWLAEDDAEAVASYPYAVAHVCVRPVLVDALLDLAEADLLRNREFSGLKIERLEHPDLAAQLRTALATRSTLRGRAAAILAEACSVRDVHADLMTVALDEACDSSLRVRAVMAASALDRPTTAAQLRPSLTDPAAEFSDELRGALLEATWPEALSAAELVAALGPETRPTVFDLYALFLHRLPERLEDEDLPVLLRWAAGRSTASDGYSVRRGARRNAELCNRLIMRAWEANDRTVVLPALAEFMIERLGDDLYFDAAVPLESATPADVRDRRALVRLIVEQAQNRATIPRLAASPLSRSLRLISPADLTWFLEQEAAAEAPVVPRWHQLIRIRFNPADPQHRLAAQRVSGSRIWSAVLAPLLETDQGESETYLQQGAAAPALDAVFDVPDHAGERQDIIDALTAVFERSESGDLEAFWQLCRHLHIDPDNGFDSSRWSDDITTRPGYRALKERHSDLDDRFHTLACRYLRRHHPHTDDWIDQVSVMSWPAHSGYLAFAFLERCFPASFDALEDGVWATWAAALLVFDATPDSTSAFERKRRILHQLSLRAPDAATEPFQRIIRTAGQAGQIAHVLRSVDSCWSPGLADALADDLLTLRDGAPQQDFETALRLLLEHDHDGTTGFALRAVRDNSGEVAQATGRRVALVMLCAHPATAFPDIFEQMRQRPDWGRALATDLARAYRPTDPLSGLQDAQLAALYTWLLEQYPPEHDTFEPEFQFTTPEQETRIWRERAAHHLIERATLTTIDELAALAADNPNRPWLRRMLATAQERYRDVSWSPPRLTDLRAMAKDAGRRYARDDNDLREAVIEQLGRLQERMRGKTPEAFFLWNETRESKSVSKWTPKYESEISDYIAVHLKTHLRYVFTNREVEIDRTISTGVGDRVDLLCEAFDPDDPESMTQYQIVIEVKGCWNDGLTTDLHDQLAADYMPKVGTRHGIYLVGYFPKAQWEPGANRYQKTPDLTADQLKSELVQLADQELTLTRNTITAFVLDFTRPEQRQHTASKRRIRRSDPEK
jgi:hypothetical protein